jgi:hypothetical protein
LASKTARTACLAGTEARDGNMVCPVQRTRTRTAEDDGWDDAEAEVELGRTARSAIGPCEFVTVLWTDIQLP